MKTPYLKRWKREPRPCSRAPQAGRGSQRKMDPSAQGARRGSQPSERRWPLPIKFSGSVEESLGDAYDKGVGVDLTTKGFSWMANGALCGITDLLANWYRAPIYWQGTGRLLSISDVRDEKSLHQEKLRHIDEQINEAIKKDRLLKEWAKSLDALR